jgi:hypothetical protein
MKHIYSGAADLCEQITTHNFISLKGRQKTASSLTKHSQGETEPNGSLRAAMRTLKSKGEVEGNGKEKERKRGTYLL